MVIERVMEGDDPVGVDGSGLPRVSLQEARAGTAGGAGGEKVA
jgi:hypothetical protein